MLEEPQTATVMEWPREDKRQFWKLLGECFTSVTDEDAKDAYARCKSFGITASCEALRKLRDAEKGKAWRPDLPRLEAIAKQLSAGTEAAGIARSIELAEAARRYERLRTKSPLQMAYERAAIAAEATDEPELFSMRDELFRLKPDLAKSYRANADPRKLKSLALELFEPAFVGVQV